jgi:hypothetical protein
MSGAWWTPPGQSAGFGDMGGGLGDMSSVWGQGAGIGTSTPMGGMTPPGGSPSLGDWSAPAAAAAPAPMAAQAAPAWTGLGMGGSARPDWSRSSRNFPRGPDMSGVLGMGADGPIAAHGNAYGVGMEQRPWQSGFLPNGNAWQGNRPEASPTDAMNAHARNRLGVLGR